MFTEYVDFEIQIGALSESRHAVTASGPGGDASGALVLPTHDPIYQALAARLAALDTDEAMLGELGRLLFGALFQGAIRDVYIRSLGTLTPDQGLRLRLNIGPDAAAAIALPWEFLYDPDQGPLALLDAPVMRYLPQAARVPTLETTLPLKVLVTGAQTPPQMEVERELNEVTAALSKLGQHVQITVEPHLTTGKLQKLLRDGFHIWHFVGHGGFGKDGSTGRLLFEDASGDAEPISSMQLGIMLNRSGLRLVVLDACQGGKLATDPFRSMAPALIRAQIPAVIAMQFSVPESATRAFAGEFYRSLAEGFPIDACVTEGRKAVMNASGLHNADWGIPVVYTRAPDGRLFRLPSQPPLLPTAIPPAPAPLPAPAPDAAPPERRTSNLPTMPTALVGRNQDIAAARALIERPDVRLLTLIGPSGTGKTRLAIQIAADLVGSFAHGVWLVDLAPIGTSELVLPTIAHTLGVKETSDRPLLEMLQDYLRGRETLLVLDNFEQVLAAAPLIAAALQALPQLQVMVTSRAALRISGEYEFPVSPLALPDLRQIGPLEELARNPAVALFVERARAVKPSFRLIDANARAVAEICARLDGLPLAIELAAARINVLAPQALLARLSNRLELLTGGARDLATRQQTLRGAITWSYDLLNAAERMLFAALAVFAGGATMEAIEAVCRRGELEVGGLEPDAAIAAPRSNAPTSILDGLASLVDKSLLRQIESADGAARFVMLETIREYAQERLAASSGAAGLRRRHAEHYLALAEQAEPELSGAEQAAWLDRLEAEHDNMRTALVFCLEASAQGDHDINLQPPASSLTEIGLRLSGALGRFWWIRGYLSEGRDLLDRALAAQIAIRNRDQRAPKEARAKALNATGLLAWVQADYKRAQLYYTECLSLRKELAEPARIAQALNNLGMVTSTLGDYARAIELYTAALTIYRKNGNQLGAARALNNLGTVSQRQGDQQQAKRFYEDSLALFRGLQDHQSTAILLRNLGEIELQLANYAQALDYYTEGLTLHQSMGDKGGIATSLEGLANIAAQQDRMESAVRLWSAADLLREAANIQHEPSERAAHQQVVADTQARIGAARWNAAWAAGRAMSLEQALTEAKSTERITTPIKAIAAAPAGPQIIVATTDGPRVITLDRLPLTIGRGNTSDIILDDPRVSRRHAQISYRAHAIILADLGSSNGTFVGGERIAERALHDGDTISFGGLEATFNAAAGAATSNKDT
jgi:predicted ATPase